MFGFPHVKKTFLVFPLKNTYIDNCQIALFLHFFLIPKKEMAMRASEVAICPACGQEKNHGGKAKVWFPLHHILSIKVIDEENGIIQIEYKTKSPTRAPLWHEGHQKVMEQVAEFIKKGDTFFATIGSVPKGEMHTRFEAFCHCMNWQTPSKSMFGKIMKRLYCIGVREHRGANGEYWFIPTKEDMVIRTSLLADPPFNFVDPKELDRMIKEVTK